ncbi:MAG TPA: type II toxin-antitoxin system HicA family toxin [Verrucomicrobiae bacterium]|nr:type II toxin-antitoxin system HicA family toxin [Verrucomicrobiae bacterium]
MSRFPAIRAAELLKFLKDNGFVPLRQAGSHLTLYNQERDVAVTVPIHKGHDLGRGLTLRILKDAGFTTDDFLNWR